MTLTLISQGQMEGDDAGEEDKAPQPLSVPPCGFVAAASERLKRLRFKEQGGSFYPNPDEGSFLKTQTT